MQKIGKFIDSYFLIWLSVNFYAKPYRGQKSRLLLSRLLVLLISILLITSSFPIGYAQIDADPGSADKNSKNTVLIYDSPVSKLEKDPNSKCLEQANQAAKKCADACQPCEVSVKEINGKCDVKTKNTGSPIPGCIPKISKPENQVCPVCEGRKPPNECQKCPSCDIITKVVGDISKPEKIDLTDPSPWPIGKGDKEKKQPKCGNGIQELGEDFDFGKKKSSQESADQQCERSNNPTARGKYVANLNSCKCELLQSGVYETTSCPLYTQSEKFVKPQESKTEDIKPKEFGDTGDSILETPKTEPKKNPSDVVLIPKENSVTGLLTGYQIADKIDKTENLPSGEVKVTMKDGTTYTYTKEGEKVFVTSYTKGGETEFYKKTDKGVKVTNNKDDTYYIYIEREGLREVVETKRTDGVVEKYSRNEENFIVIERSDGTKSVFEEIERGGERPIKEKRKVLDVDKDGKSTTFVYLPNGITRLIFDDGSYQSYIEEDGEAFVIESGDSKGKKAFYAKLKDGSIHVAQDKNETKSYDYIALPDGTRRIIRYTESGQTFNQELLENGLLKISPIDFSYTNPDLFAKGHPYYRNLPEVEKPKDLFSGILSFFKSLTGFQVGYESANRGTNQPKPENNPKYKIIDPDTGSLYFEEFKDGSQSVYIYQGETVTKINPKDGTWVFFKDGLAISSVSSTIEFDGIFSRKIFYIINYIKETESSPQSRVTRESVEKEDEEQPPVQRAITSKCTETTQEKYPNYLSNPVPLPTTQDKGTITLNESTVDPKTKDSDKIVLGEVPGYEPVEYAGEVYSLFPTQCSQQPTDCNLVSGSTNREFCQQCKQRNPPTVSLESCEIYRDLECNHLEYPASQYCKQCKPEPKFEDVYQAPGIGSGKGLSPNLLWLLPLIVLLLLLLFILKKKRKKQNKIISLFLIFTLIFSSVPNTAAAPISGITGFAVDQGNDDLDNRFGGVTSGHLPEEHTFPTEKKIDKNGEERAPQERDYYGKAAEYIQTKLENNKKAEDLLEHIKSKTDAVNADFCADTVFKSKFEDYKKFIKENLEKKQKAIDEGNKQMGDFYKDLDIAAIKLSGQINVQNAFTDVQNARANLDQLEQGFENALEHLDILGNENNPKYNPARKYQEGLSQLTPEEQSKLNPNFLEAVNKLDEKSRQLRIARKLIKTSDARFKNAFEAVGKDIGKNPAGFLEKYVAQYPGKTIDEVVKDIKEKGVDLAKLESAYKSQIGNPATETQFGKLVQKLLKENKGLEYSVNEQKKLEKEVESAEQGVDGASLALPGEIRAKILSHKEKVKGEATQLAGKFLEQKQLVSQLFIDDVRSFLLGATNPLTGEKLKSGLDFFTESLSKLPIDEFAKIVLEENIVQKLNRIKDKLEKNPNLELEDLAGEEQGLLRKVEKFNKKAYVQQKEQEQKELTEKVKKFDYLAQLSLLTNKINSLADGIEKRKDSRSEIQKKAGEMRREKEIKTPKEADELLSGINDNTFKANEADSQLERPKGSSFQKNVFSTAVDINNKVVSDLSEKKEVDKALVYFQLASLYAMGEIYSEKADALETQSLEGMVHLLGLKVLGCEIPEEKRTKGYTETKSEQEGESGVDVSTKERTPITGQQVKVLGNVCPVVFSPCVDCRCFGIVYSEEMIGAAQQFSGKEDPLKTKEREEEQKKQTEQEIKTREIPEKKEAVEFKYPVDRSSDLERRILEREEAKAMELERQTLGKTTQDVFKAFDVDLEIDRASNLYKYYASKQAYGQEVSAENWKTLSDRLKGLLTKGLPKEAKEKIEAILRSAETRQGFGSLVESIENIEEFKAVNLDESLKTADKKLEEASKDFKEGKIDSLTYTQSLADYQNAKIKAYEKWMEAGGKEDGLSIDGLKDLRGQAQTLKSLLANPGLTNELKEKLTKTLEIANKLITPETISKAKEKLNTKHTELAESLAIRKGKLTELQDNLAYLESQKDKVNLGEFIPNQIEKIKQDIEGLKKEISDLQKDINLVKQNIELTTDLTITTQVEKEFGKFPSLFVGKDRDKLKSILDTERERLKAEEESVLVQYNKYKSKLDAAEAKWNLPFRDEETERREAGEKFRLWSEKLNAIDGELSKLDGLEEKFVKNNGAYSEEFKKGIRNEISGLANSIVDEKYKGTKFAGSTSQRKIIQSKNRLDVLTKQQENIFIEEAISNGASPTDALIDFHSGQLAALTTEILRSQRTKNQPGATLYKGIKGLSGEKDVENFEASKIDFLKEQLASEHATLVSLITKNPPKDPQKLAAVYNHLILGSSEINQGEFLDRFGNSEKLGIIGFLKMGTGGLQRFSDTDWDRRRLGSLLGQVSDRGQEAIDEMHEYEKDLLFKSGWIDLNNKLKSPDIGKGEVDPSLQSLDYSKLALPEVSVVDKFINGKALADAAATVILPGAIAGRVGLVAEEAVVRVGASKAIGSVANWGANTLTFWTSSNLAKFATGGQVDTSLESLAHTGLTLGVLGATGSISHLGLTKIGETNVGNALLRSPGIQKSVEFASETAGFYALERLTRGEEASFWESAITTFQLKLAGVPSKLRGEASAQTHDALKETLGEMDRIRAGERTKQAEERLEVLRGKLNGLINDPSDPALKELFTVRVKEGTPADVAQRISLELPKKAVDLAFADKPPEFQARAADSIRDLVNKKSKELTEKGSTNPITKAEIIDALTKDNAKLPPEQRIKLGEAQTLADYIGRVPFIIEKTPAKDAVDRSRLLIENLKGPKPEDAEYALVLAGKNSGQREQILRDLKLEAAREKISPRERLRIEDTIKKISETSPETNLLLPEPFANPQEALDIKLGIKSEAKPTEIEPFSVETARIEDLKVIDVLTSKGLGSLKNLDLDPRTIEGRERIRKLGILASDLKFSEIESLRRGQIPKSLGPFGLTKDQINSLVLEFQGGKTAEQVRGSVSEKLREEIKPTIPEERIRDAQKEGERISEVKNRVQSDLNAVFSEIGIEPKPHIDRLFDSMSGRTSRMEYHNEQHIGDGVPRSAEAMRNIKARDARFVELVGEENFKTSTEETAAAYLKHDDGYNKNDGAKGHEERSEILAQKELESLVDEKGKRIYDDQAIGRIKFQIEATRFAVHATKFTRIENILQDFVSRAKKGEQINYKKLIEDLNTIAGETIAKDPATGQDIINPQTKQAQGTATISKAIEDASKPEGYRTETFKFEDIIKEGNLVDIQKALGAVRGARVIGTVDVAAHTKYLNLLKGLWEEFVREKAIVAEPTPADQIAATVGFLDFVAGPRIKEFGQLDFFDQSKTRTEAHREFIGKFSNFWKGFVEKTGGFGNFDYKLKKEALSESDRAELDKLQKELNGLGYDFSLTEIVEQSIGLLKENGALENPIKVKNVQDFLQKEGIFDKSRESEKTVDGKEVTKETIGSQLKDKFKQKKPSPKETEPSIPEETKLTEEDLDQLNDHSTEELLQEKPKTDSSAYSGSQSDLSKLKEDTRLESPQERAKAIEEAKQKLDDLKAKNVQKIYDLLTDSRSVSSLVYEKTVNDLLKGKTLDLAIINLPMTSFNSIDGSLKTGDLVKDRFFAQIKKEIPSGVKIGETGGESIGYLGTRIVLTGLPKDQLSKASQIFDKVVDGLVKEYDSDPTRKAFAEKIKEQREKIKVFIGSKQIDTRGLDPKIKEIKQKQDKGEAISSQESEVLKSGQQKAEDVVLDAIKDSVGAVETVESNGKETDLAKKALPGFDSNILSIDVEGKVGIDSSLESRANKEIGNKRSKYVPPFEYSTGKLPRLDHELGRMNSVIDEAQKALETYSKNPTSENRNTYQQKIDAIQKNLKEFYQKSLVDNRFDKVLKKNAIQTVVDLHKTNPELLKELFKGSSIEPGLYMAKLGDEIGIVYEIIDSTGKRKLVMAFGELDKFNAFNSLYIPDGKDSYYHKILDRVIEHAKKTGLQNGVTEEQNIRFIEGLKDTVENTEVKIESKQPLKDADGNPISIKVKRNGQTVETDALEAGDVVRIGDMKFHDTEKKAGRREPQYENGKAKLTTLGISVTSDPLTEVKDVDSKFRELSDLNAKQKKGLGRGTAMTAEEAKSRLKEPREEIKPTIPELKGDLSLKETIGEIPLEELELLDKGSSKEGITKIGQGAFGSVYSVKKDGREYAVKIYKKVAKQEDIDNEFDVGRRAKDIDGVVQYRSRIRENGKTVGLVQDYAEGKTLFEKILNFEDKAGKEILTENDYIPDSYLTQLESTVSSLHAQLITHRDLNKANIIFTKDGIKIIDFGISKAYADKNNPDFKENKKKDLIKLEERLSDLRPLKESLYKANSNKFRELLENEITSAISYIDKLLIDDVISIRDAKDKKEKAIENLKVFVKIGKISDFEFNILIVRAKEKAATEAIKTKETSSFSKEIIDSIVNKMRSGLGAASGDTVLFKIETISNIVKEALETNNPEKLRDARDELDNLALDTSKYDTEIGDALDAINEAGDKLAEQAAIDAAPFSRFEEKKANFHGSTEKGKFSGYTESGDKESKQTNEDSLLVNPEQGLFVVVDGMGGFSAGEVASRLGAQAINKAIAEGLALERALVKTQSALQSTEGHATAAAAQVKGNKLFASTVGDARIYVYGKDGKLKYISKDQSKAQETLEKLVETLGGDAQEAIRAEKDMRGKNIVTNSISSEGLTENPQGLFKATDPKSVSPEGRILTKDKALGSIDLEEGDVVIVASDGLVDYLPYTESKNPMDHLSDAVKEGSSPKDISKRIISSYEGGGKGDNIGLVIYQHGKAGKPEIVPSKPPLEKSVVREALEIELTEIEILEKTIKSKEQSLRANIAKERQTPAVINIFDRFFGVSNSVKIEAELSQLKKDLREKLKSLSESAEREQDIPILNLGLIKTDNKEEGLEFLFKARKLGVGRKGKYQIHNPAIWFNKETGEIIAFATNDNPPQDLVKEYRKKHGEESVAIGDITIVIKPRNEPGGLYRLINFKAYDKTISPEAQEKIKETMAEYNKRYGFETETDIETNVKPTIKAFDVEGLKIESGTEIPEGKEIIIGRGETANWKANDLSVSNQHAKLYYDKFDRLVIEDLGSKNGVLVNGEKITYPKPLNIGDEVVLGSDTKFTIGQEIIKPRGIKNPTTKNIETEFLTENKDKIRIITENKNNENKINTDWLEENFFQPIKTIEFEGKKYHISEPKLDSKGRVFFALYFEDNGEIYLRPLYKSRSNSAWRTLSSYFPGFWYGKGIGTEESVSYPIELQKVFEAESAGAKRVKDDVIDKFLVGVSRLGEIGQTFIGGSKETSLDSIVPGDNIQRLDIGRWETEEDLSKGRRSQAEYKQKEAYGLPSDDVIRNSKPYKTYVEAIGREVDSYIIDSKNGELTYLIFHDLVTNAVWIGSLQIKDINFNKYGVNSNRLSPNVIVSGKYNLLMPAFEYSSQVPSEYLGSHISGSYSDATKFTDTLPPVKAFKKALGIPKSGVAKGVPVLPKIDEVSSLEGLKEYVKNLYESGDSIKSPTSGRVYTKEEVLNLLEEGERIGEIKFIPTAIRWKFSELLGKSNQGFIGPGPLMISEVVRAWIDFFRGRGEPGKTVEVEPKNVGGKTESTKQATEQPIKPETIKNPTQPVTRREFIPHSYDEFKKNDIPKIFDPSQKIGEKGQYMFSEMILAADNYPDSVLNFYYYYGKANEAQKAEIRKEIANSLNSGWSSLLRGRVDTEDPQVVRGVGFVYNSIGVIEDELWARKAITPDIKNAFESPGIAEGRLNDLFALKLNFVHGTQKPENFLNILLEGQIRSSDKGKVFFGGLSTTDTQLKDSDAGLYGPYYIELSEDINTRYKQGDIFSNEHKYYIVPTRKVKEALEDALDNALKQGLIKNAEGELSAEEYVEWVKSRLVTYEERLSVLKTGEKPTVSETKEENDLLSSISEGQGTPATGYIDLNTALESLKKAKQDLDSGHVESTENEIKTVQEILEVGRGQPAIENNRKKIEKVIELFKNRIEKLLSEPIEAGLYREEITSKVNAKLGEKLGGDIKLVDAVDSLTEIMKYYDLQVPEKDPRIQKALSSRDVKDLDKTLNLKMEKSKWNKVLDEFFSVLITKTTDLQALDTQTNQPTVKSIGYDRVNIANKDKIFSNIVPSKKRLTETVLGTKAVGYLTDAGEWKFVFLSESIQTQHRHALGDLIGGEAGQLIKEGKYDEAAKKGFNLANAFGWQIQYDKATGQIVGIQMESEITNAQKNFPIKQFVIDSANDQLLERIPEELLTKIIEKEPSLKPKYQEGLGTPVTGFIEMRRLTKLAEEIDSLETANEKRAKIKQMREYFEKNKDQMAQSLWSVVEANTEANEILLISTKLKSEKTILSQIASKLNNGKRDYLRIKGVERTDVEPIHQGVLDAFNLLKINRKNLDSELVSGIEARLANLLVSDLKRTTPEWFRGSGPTVTYTGIVDLSSGATGIVLKGFVENQQGEKAIKIYRTFGDVPDEIGEQIISKMKKEIESMRVLEKLGIGPKLIGEVNTGAYPGFAMELVKGISLKQLLTMSKTEIKSILTQEAIEKAIENVKKLRDAGYGDPDLEFIFLSEDQTVNGKQYKRGDVLIIDAESLNKSPESWKTPKDVERELKELIS